MELVDAQTLVVQQDGHLRTIGNGLQNRRLRVQVLSPLPFCYVPPTASVLRLPKSLRFDTRNSKCFSRSSSFSREVIPVEGARSKGRYLLVNRLSPRFARSTMNLNSPTFRHHAHRRYVTAPTNVARISHERVCIFEISVILLAIACPTA